MLGVGSSSLLGPVFNLSHSRKARRKADLLLLKKCFADCIRREVKKWHDKIRARPAVDRGLNEPLGKWENESKIKGGDEAHAKKNRELISADQILRPGRAKTD